MSEPLPMSVLSEIINTQTAIAGAALDEAEVMRLVCERTERLTHADAAAVELPEGDQMVYRAATGSAASHLGLRLAMATSLSGRCVRTGEVLLCTDTEDDARVNQEACRRIGVRSMIVVPLLDGLQPVGVLKVMSAQPSRFGAQQLAVLQLMAGMITSAMRNAQSFGRAQAALAEVQRIAEQNQRAALSDPLSGLGNRRGGEQALAREMARARRNKLPLSLALFDIDHFKRINDEHGHAVGDAVIRAVALVIAGAARESDLAVRWGGEEFLLVLPDTAVDGARICADRVRALVQARVSDGLPRVTISGGVAEIDVHEASGHALARADSRLYEAKASGRNIVC